MTETKEISTINKIHKILEWYHVRGSTSSLDELIRTRDKLATWSCNLALETSDAFQGYNHAYFMRKVNTSRKINNLTKQGLAVNKAENEAIEALAEAWELEKESEAEAHRYDLFLKQVNKVLDAMSHRISHERDEKRNMQMSQN